MDKKYYGGILNINRDKRSEKSPDLGGDVEISRELLKSLVEMAKANQPIKMRAAAWLREGSKGKFYSLSLSEKQEQKARVDDEIPF
jgi:hypothetical protein